ncbi:MAG: RimK family alpha-L-glutamate ligase [Myxococcales bacterium]
MQIAHQIDRQSRKTTSPHPRIAIAAELRYFTHRQPAALGLALLAAGHEAEFLDPTSRAPLPDLDLLVVRGRSPEIFALLERAEAKGIRTTNRRAAIAAVVDKSSMGRALESAGIPTPRTRVGSFAAVARDSRPEDFPMVVKPVFGDNARGVRIVASREELLSLEWKEPEVIAQPYLPSDGFDLKLYVAGEEVRAVKKPSPLATGMNVAALPVTVTPELRALALRCGVIFGLDLFGVDCIETPGGPVVIEVNDFPNYSGLGEMDGFLARFILDRARYSVSCGSRR